ncbi:phage tail protein [Candidatus Pantoea persica]|uniref:phage tail protein n=1 Tax=Candidatus Pantoea persica TaxID=2518128 RepID=UPI00215D859A|nr:phage tail protein [Candidatus Pantoea persica]
MVVPVGVPLPWPAENPPAGWLKCNGDTFDKVACPQLAAVYPSGRTPDLRGEFIRGWDDGRGINPGRALLSLEYGALQSHKHGYRDRYYVEHGRPLGRAEHKEAAPENYNNKVGSGATDGDNDYFLYIDSTTSPSGSSETRPVTSPLITS